MIESDAWEFKSRTVNGSSIEYLKSDSDFEVRVEDAELVLWSDDLFHSSSYLDCLVTDLSADLTAATASDEDKNCLFSKWVSLIVTSPVLVLCLIFIF